LLPVINKLQDVLGSMGADPLDLPQIAVVGSQSAGKSSVLETLVGKDFLPRGNDIVTRRPLILQLLNTNHLNGPNRGKEWATFLHTKDERWYDYRKIRSEIRRETDRVAPGQAISDNPIRLAIYSPSVVNLTIVDLPGMTKVPVGNQPKDIDEQIRRLLLKYIKKENCIILAISPANSDLANSDALQLARRVDPNGNRTLGVITKVDLMDQGTNALNYLNGKVVPLKLGYVGIVNRSQQDINDGKTIQDAIKSESRFFSNHKDYRSISDRCGSSYLGIQMNKILINHIKKVLPNIKIQIQKDISKMEDELAGYGVPIIETEQAMSALLLNLITQFSTNFSNTIDGVGIDESKMNSNELFGGARILYTFRVSYQKEVMRVHAHDGLSSGAIRTAIRNASGAKSSLFVPEMAFEILVKGQIEKLRRPALNCVELVFEELQRVAAQSTTTQMSRFDQLSVQLLESVNLMLRSRMDPVREFINKLIDVELSYINTNHPHFVSGSRAVQSSLDAIHVKQEAPAPVPRQPVDKKKTQNWSIFGGGAKQNSAEEKIAPPAPAPRRQPAKPRSRGKSLGDPNMGPVTDREKVEISLVKILIKSYFDIVKKSILDAVPKAIMLLLVNHVKKKLQAELVYKLYNESQFNTLLRESPEVAQKRKMCIELLMVLKKSLEIVNEVRDFKI